ncbi:hypothetical protein KUTeg_001016 [Tegillarca granosa]|uniref:Uncharacterized protein n=1 Tax=Tegillarca granosa TaxID=220873 RepID=A0ABQ9FW16_TEGGR|nr:hypothetical protein KUTeg_001016 [Tegillarca granosa]
MLLCQWEEVVMSQAYILFYVKQDTNFNMNSISDLAQPFKEEKNISLNSHHDVSITDDETFYTPESSLKMSLSQIVDNEITFNFKTPELLSQTSRKRTSTDTLDLSKRVLKRRRSTFWVKIK